MKPASTELREQLRQVAREVLSSVAPGECDDWKLGAELGWWGLDTPEEHGGAGASFAETATVLVELGRVAASVPTIGSFVSLSALFAMLRPDERVRLLWSGLARGSLRPVLIRSGEFGATHPIPLADSAGSTTLSGSMRRVLDLEGADTFIVPVELDGDTNGFVEVTPGSPGVSVKAVELVDSTRSVCDVSFDDVVVASEPMRLADTGSMASSVDAWRELWRVLDDRATVAIACDSIGLGEAMLDATVRYVSMREQFGRPVGSFQAVQHACADMAVELALCRRLLGDAVDAVCAHDSSVVAETSSASVAPGAVARAGAYIAEAAVGIVGKAIQLHGGIGYTWDAGLHVHLKRAALNRALFGTPADHRRRLAATLIPPPHECRGEK